MLQRFEGCLVGLAVGDALGYPVEFLNRSELQRKLGPLGVTGFVPHSGRVGLYSDDTQMTITVARALLDSDLGDLDDVMRHIKVEFSAWARAPENDRSPGQACLDGIARMDRGVHWFSSGDPYSKGCGAAMRVAPIGLLFRDDPEKLIEVARATAICTHAHPTGVASAIAAAVAVAHAARGEPPDQLPGAIERALVHLRPSGERVTHDPLGEQLKKLDDLRRALAGPPGTAFDVVGPGWTGEEAVAGALYAFLRSPADFRATVLTGANAALTDEDGPGRGRCDSDSIACIAGGVSGAYNGLAAIPEEWASGVENAPLLLELAGRLSEKAGAR
ncbi:MAG: ADP-ribosylglycohydrolase family protein [Myxococcota bacterium]|nr:ADP-ribosylglycohydrolase family protein [Myxococcota bacterium]